MGILDDIFSLRSMNDLRADGFWPTSVYVFVANRKAIFAYGSNAGGSNTPIINLVSDTGVVSTDGSGVTTGRSSLAAAGYGTDKAILGYGANNVGNNLSFKNLVSNTGAVAADVTGVGSARQGLAAQDTVQIKLYLVMDIPIAVNQ